MYKRNLYTVIENKALTECIYRMTVRGDTQYITAPGQFVNIELEGRFLRRPISVCDWDDDTITLIYKVVGGGTGQMSTIGPGAMLDMLTGLGNGFTVDTESERPLVVGGGVGVPPMFNLVKKLIAGGHEPTVALGFNSACDVFYEREFAALNVPVYVATADGSHGAKGFVTDMIAATDIDHDYIYACGPLPMLRALGTAFPGPGQFSFEERMGCGFGGCMGCSCKTRNGNKRICREGPVLTTDEIIWEEC